MNQEELEFIFGKKDRIWLNFMLVIQHADINELKFKFFPCGKA